MAYDSLHDPRNAHLEADVSRTALLHRLSMGNAGSSRVRLVPACSTTQSQCVSL